MSENIKNTPQEQESNLPEENSLPENKVLFDLGDPTVPNFFSNNIYIDVRASDIQVVFMHDFHTFVGTKTQPVARIIFSHADFAKMAQFINSRAVFLKTVYGGQIPNAFNSVDSDTYQNALDTMNQWYVDNDSKETKDNE